MPCRRDSLSFLNFKAMFRVLSLFVRILVLSVFVIGGGIALVYLCARIALGCFGLLFE